jgi:aminoglycoside 6'-N-acetyltransferase I
MIIVTRNLAPDDAAWLNMREALWPHADREAHLDEMSTSMMHPATRATFLAHTEKGLVVGFAEVSIRSEQVNGARTSPVGFLEGLYVHPDYRRHGAAGKLVGKVEQWVLEQGCHELASDTDAGNTVSQAVHTALGFEETERVVYFRKELG